MPKAFIKKAIRKALIKKVSAVTKKALKKAFMEMRSYLTITHVRTIMRDPRISLKRRHTSLL